MQKGLTVLVLDGGGRGSALVDKYAQSPQVKKILAIPGNDLMQINTNKPVKTYPSLKTTSVQEILAICKKQKVDLVDVAQDNAVESGLTNVLLANGINAVGPTKEAGQIEWDKAWARQFMKKYNLPIPAFRIFTNEVDGIKFLKNAKNSAWFVKANGLLEGKGALPAKDNNEAIVKIKELRKFGDAGKTFLLEEWVVGEEFSSFALSDGIGFKIIGSAQDHKRVFNFDEGENTGGMGCSAPPLVLSKTNIKNQIKKIFEKTFAGLRTEGRPYTGILYLGGILVGEKVYIIEFNARWGSPEAEVLVPGIKNDFVDVANAIIRKKISKLNLKIDNHSRVSAVGASSGYPDDYSKVKGKQIFGIEKILKMKGVRFYSAGIKKVGGKFLANGGRLFHIVGEGNNILEARQKAYSAMSQIYIEGNNLHFRTDIGFRDVERLVTNRVK